jgi:hypothetical protein
LRPSSTSRIRIADLAEFGLAETAGGACRRAEADTRGDRRLFRIVGNAILVAGDEGAAKRGFRGLAGQALRPQVGQHQMGVGAARDDVQTTLDQGFGQRLGVATTLEM